MSSRTVFLDTSFIVALENKRDSFHLIAKQLDREFQHAGVEYLLYRGIVLEVGDGFARRARRGKGIDFVRRFHEEDGYRVEPIDESVWRKAVDLYVSRPDKEWGLTDCVSFALMEREGIKEALTADPHFRQAGFVPLLLEPEIST